MPRVLGLLRRIAGRLVSRSARERRAEARLCATLFDARFYLDRNPDVAHAGIDPLEHYLRFGSAEGRRPHPLFDPAFYRAQLDIELPASDALRHFLGSAPHELRPPHPLFDPAWYLATNPEVAAAGTNPLVHYLQAGAVEGRPPSRAAAGAGRWFAGRRLEGGGHAGQVFLALATQHVDTLAMLTRAFAAAGFEVLPPGEGVACGSRPAVVVVDEASGASALPAAMACHPEARIVYLDTGAPAGGVGPVLAREAGAVLSDSRPPAGPPWLDLARLRGELAAEAAGGLAPPVPPRSLAGLLRRAGIQPPTLLGDRLEALARASAPRVSGDVVVLAIVPWRYRFQRPQQLSAAMGRAGRRVIYVDPEFLPAADARPYRIDESPTDNVYTVRLRCGGLVDIHASPPSPPQLAALTNGLRSLVRGLESPSPVVVVEAAFWLPLARALPRSLLVHDCMDLYRGFANVSRELVDLEEELVRAADLVVLSSSSLERWTGQARRAVVVRNGCDFQRFASAVSRSGPERPVVGYVGAIDAWFDAGLVASCARARPQWEFLLAGAASEPARDALQGTPNLRLLGEVDYEEVPELVAGFDVAIVPFVDDELTRCVNPVKAYEYLAAGKPVVSTPLPELALFPEGLVRIGHAAEEFLAALDAAMADTGRQRQQRRREWAAGQGWDGRAAEFLAAIEAARGRPEARC